MSNTNLNDESWEQLFNKYNILHCIESDGYFEISATQIKEFREPRLMSKFDHKKNLPKLFSDNQLAILPVTRGNYVISHFDAYHKLESNNVPIQRVSLPSHIQSLNFNNVPSELIALNSAFAAGIIDEFMEDDAVVSTVSGRMSSDSFSFKIRDIENSSFRYIDVNNAQIEIDAAYEGISYLALFEAKMDISDDFLIRQLYYPFRLWHNRLTKPVKSIFFIYSNGIYTLYEYHFEDPENYNSLQCVKQRRYSIEDTMISVQDIQKVLENVKLTTEPHDIPFPQADKFERVVNLCELANFHELSRKYITEHYDFDVRQTNYYADAGRYLGILEKIKEDSRTFYKITTKGKHILELNFKQRQLEYCNCILSHRAFNESLKLYFKYGTMPSSEQVVNIMGQSGLYNVESKNTFTRRSSTIKSWLNWIISLINE